MDHGHGYGYGYGYGRLEDLGFVSIYSRTEHRRGEARRMRGLSAEITIIIRTNYVCRYVIYSPSEVVGAFFLALAVIYNCMCVYLFAWRRILTLDLCSR